MALPSCLFAFGNHGGTLATVSGSPGFLQSSFILSCPEAPVSLPASPSRTSGLKLCCLLSSSRCSRHPRMALTITSGPLARARQPSTQLSLQWWTRRVSFSPHPSPWPLTCGVFLQGQASRAPSSPGCTSLLLGLFCFQKPDHPLLALLPVPPWSGSHCLGEECGSCVSDCALPRAAFPTLDLPRPRCPGLFWCSECILRAGQFSRVAFE